jgi:hypothetical protein
MKEAIDLLLRHAAELREKGVLRVKCGDFEAELAPAVPAPLAEVGNVEETAATARELPKRRGLRAIVEGHHE